MSRATARAAVSLGLYLAKEKISPLPTLGAGNRSWRIDQAPVTGSSPSRSLARQRSQQQWNRRLPSLGARQRQPQLPREQRPAPPPGTLGTLALLFLLLKEP